MPLQINMCEAKTNLSQLAERAWAGEKVIIAKNGKPYLGIRPYATGWKMVIKQVIGQLRIEDEDLDSLVEEEEIAHLPMTFSTAPRPAYYFSTTRTRLVA